MRELFHGADVLGMKVRDHDEPDAIRIESGVGELRSRVLASLLRHGHEATRGADREPSRGLALFEAGAGVTPTELYRSLMLSSGAMTHRLDRLEAAGLVKRREDERDRRGYRIALTRKGRELVDRAVVAHVENEERRLAPLTKSERETLNGLLKKLLLSVGS